MYSRKSLLPPPFLALPRLKGQYTIDTDACDSKVGRVLLQQQKSKVLKRIGYWSWTLYDAETRNESTHEKFLAVFWAKLHLCSYIEGTHSMVRIDH